LLEGPNTKSTIPRLLFLQYNSIFENYGGIEYYLDDLIKLAGETYGYHSIHSIIPKRGKLRDCKVPYAATFVPLASNPFLRKLENRLSPAYFGKAKRLIKEFRPSLLINTHVKLGPLTYLLSKLSRIPYVTVVYGVDCWGRLWPQDEFCLRRSQGIVSISEWTQKVLVDRGYGSEKISIIHPRISTEFENQAERRMPGQFTLLSISRLDPSERYKGQDDVLKALAILKKKGNLHWKYIIMGDGEDKERLQALTKELDLQAIVEFRGSVKEREDLRNVYRQASVYVMPSKFGFMDGRWCGEGFGIVYAEAGAMGVPSVAYRCGGATDVIEDRVTGRLVQPHNPEALAQALFELGSRPSLVERMGKTARKRIQESFTRPAIRKQLQNFVKAHVLQGKILDLSSEKTPALNE